MLRTLREKCPNTDFFWSVFSPNTGKYGPEKTPYLDIFYAGEEKPSNRKIPKPDQRK